MWASYSFTNFLTHSLFPSPSFTPSIPQFLFRPVSFSSPYSNPPLYSPVSPFYPRVAPLYPQWLLVYSFSSSPPICHSTFILVSSPLYLLSLVFYPIVTTSIVMCYSFLSLVIHSITFSMSLSNYLYNGNSNLLHSTFYIPQSFLAYPLFMPYIWSNYHLYLPSYSYPPPPLPNHLLPQPSSLSRTLNTPCSPK